MLYYPRENKCLGRESEAPKSGIELIYYEGQDAFNASKGAKQSESVRVPDAHVDCAHALIQEGIEHPIRAIRFIRRVFNIGLKDARNARLLALAERERDWAAIEDARNARKAQRDCQCGSGSAVMECNNYAHPSYCG